MSGSEPVDVSDAVEAYLSQFEGDVRQRLDAVRTVIRGSAPAATEQISYGLVGYKLNGKPLVYFGGFPNHVGLYATPNAHEAFARDFAPYRQGKGSVQFPHTQPLPLELIERVVQHRVDSVSQAVNSDTQ